MNLLELVEDIEYQKRYSYEKRVDLFNKYGISTATEFFIPIWGLAQYIQDLCGIWKKYGKGYQDYGHGQRIVNSNLLDVAKTKPDLEIDNRSIRVLNNKRLDIYCYIPNEEPNKIQGKMRRIISFHVENNVLSINNFGFLSMCSIPRNLYEKIDEWLMDFEYEKWT